MGLLSVRVFLKPLSLLLLVEYLLLASRVACERATLEYEIGSTWDRMPLVGHAKIKTCIRASDAGGVEITVSSPFMKEDPQPKDIVKGSPYPWIYEYESVELFFANDKDEYIQLMTNPYGVYYIILHEGYRADRTNLRATYVVTANDTWWEGRITVPASYFPPKVTKYNAAAQHGRVPNRSYEILHPQDPDKHPNPDFHALEYFQPIEFWRVLPRNKDQTEYSQEWLAVFAAGSGTTVDANSSMFLLMGISLLGFSYLTFSL